MEGNRQQYHQLRNRLIDEMFDFTRALEQLSDQDTESIGAVMEHINESGNKLCAQIHLYTLFLQLKNNLRQMTQSVERCLN